MTVSKEKLPVYKPRTKKYLFASKESSPKKPKESMLSKLTDNNRYDYPTKQGFHSRFLHNIQLYSCNNLPLLPNDSVQRLNEELPSV